MIISAHRDLPLKSCLLCGQPLIDDIMIETHSYCSKLQRYVAENNDIYNFYHYVIWKDYINVYLSNDIKINYQSLKGEETMLLIINHKALPLPFIELDFSDIPKLIEKLLKLTNFS